MAAEGRSRSAGGYVAKLAPEGRTVKTIILLEAAVLLGGSVVQRMARGEQFSEIAVYHLGRVALADVILLAILLSLDEVGLGETAALFGGLVVLGYLLAAGGALGSATAGVVDSFFQISGGPASGGASGGGRQAEA